MSTSLFSLLALTRDELKRRLDEKLRLVVRDKLLGPCHEFVGYTKDGYGILYVPDVDSRLPRWPLRTHRLSWMLYGDEPLTDDKWVLHTCDNRRCARIEHLYLGDNDVNVLDRQERDRHARGERHPNASLTNDQAASIQQLLKTRRYHQWQIAQEFGVSESVVSRVKRGLRYARETGLER